MDLEDVKLSEISQGKTNTTGFHLYVEYKKQSKRIKTITKNQCHREQRGVMVGGG